MQQKTGRVVAGLLVVGMVLSIVLAGGASFYASSAPDGLERVAEDTGIDATAQESAVGDSPFADYQAGGGEGRFSVGLAGLVGVGVTAAVAFGMFAWLRPRDDAAPR